MIRKIYQSNAFKNFCCAVLLGVMALLICYTVLDEIDKRVWLMEKYKQEAINGRR